MRLNYSEGYRLVCKYLQILFSYLFAEKRDVSTFKLYSLFFLIR